MYATQIVLVLAALLILAAAQPARRRGPAVIGPPTRRPPQIPAAPIPAAPVTVPAATTAATSTIPSITFPVLQTLNPIIATSTVASATTQTTTTPADTTASTVVVAPITQPTVSLPPLCGAPFRSLDGTCTSELDSEVGATDRPQFSYGFTRNAATPTGGDPSSLPSARLISNIVSAQADDVFSRRGLNEMVTFMGQFLDHSIIATPVVSGLQFDILIPATDPIFSNFTNGRLSFERSVRAVDPRGRERPINEISSAIDLNSLYGPDETRLRALRTLRFGMMKTSSPYLLPLNVARLSNAPSDSPAFFVAGDRRVNENPVLTSLHTLFLREHNRFAQELQQRFPWWTDEKLFQYAKLLNTAQYQKIIFEEYYPVMTGRTLRRYRGYRPTVDPTISDVFGAAAFRVGHTMVNNQISLRAAGNLALAPIEMENMFFRENSVLALGIEPFLRGAIFERSQEVDVKVVNALRNFLFTNVQTEVGFDLMALNIQRSRDHAIPTYNELRVLFGRRPARLYRQITRNRAVQTALAAAYGSIDRIDGIVGLFAEDHLRRASMGRTMFLIWRAEFTRIRDGDRFFYLRGQMYPRDLRAGYGRELRRIFYRRNAFKRLILRNTDISRRDLRGSVWIAKERYR